MIRPLIVALLAAPLLSPAALAADAHPARRSVAVTGQGEVSATPDRARITMQVETTQSDVRAAQTEVNRVVREYLAQLKRLGIADSDIGTAGLSIQPEYEYGPKGRKFLGYRVTRGLDVRVRDLDRIGDVLLKATAAGINNVADPQLESSKADLLGREALARAAADARAKATVLAETLGMKLGPAHTLVSHADAGPPVAYKSRMAVMATADAVTESGNDRIGFSAGQIRYSATVNADFDLLAP